MSSAVTGKTEPLQPGGALMLGNEQDCYGGCTDIGQAYNGFIDEACRAPFHCMVYKAAQDQRCPVKTCIEPPILGWQVRIWRVERQQEDIITWMRRSTGLENHRCASTASLQPCYRKASFGQHIIASKR